MNIEVFVVCDAATDYAGKLNILGAYDSIIGVSSPIQIQAMVFAARIRFRAEEAGQKTCEITTIDYDGRQALPPFTAQLQVGIPEGHDSVAVNLILNVHGVAFPRPGTYRVDLKINGRILASLPLDLRVRAPAA